MDLRRSLWRLRKLCRSFVILYLIALVGIVLLFHHQSSLVILKVTSQADPLLSSTRLPPHKHPAVSAPGNSSNSSSVAWTPFKNINIDKNSNTFGYWLGDQEIFCGEKFVGFNHLFAKLHNVTVDPRKGQGRKGGEQISEVFNQAEEDEYFKLHEGYFSMDCQTKIGYSFKAKDHLYKWLNVLDINTKSRGKYIQNRWTIAVMRYEYANLYHTMTDYYNAYLMTVKFNLDPAETDILFIDGHPEGALDQTWETLFGNITRAGQLQEPVLYKNLVWNILGYYSPLNAHHKPDIPLIEPFRHFFMSRHDILKEKILSCDRLTVLFLWRRDYLAHPRNPSGLVSRKIKNEDALISGVKDLLPGHDVRGIQIDKLTMKLQLQLISETDILIGMHGAGLSFTLFLPPHAGLIELYPTYWPTANRHFRAMAQWRHLHYSVWANKQHNRELPNKYTKVDEEAVVQLVHEMHHKLCGKQADEKRWVWINPFIPSFFKWTLPSLI